MWCHDGKEAVAWGRLLTEVQARGKESKDWASKAYVLGVLVGVTVSQDTMCHPVLTTGCLLDCFYVMVVTLLLGAEIRDELKLLSGSSGCWI